MTLRLELVRRCAEAFPPLETAFEDGLLCRGGDLRPEWLLAAYACGIFPWYNQGAPLWWSPDPRCVLPLEKFRLPRRSARYLRHRDFSLSWNTAFEQVLRACAAPRRYAGREETGTWINEDMARAYTELHRLGYAHSLEVRREGALVGGLYGVSLGRAFFGESMFHRESEASRAALAGLVTLLRQRGVLLLDCQMETPHMMGMGAELWPRERYMRALREAAPSPDELRRPWIPWTERYEYADGLWHERGEEGASCGSFRLAEYA